MIFVVTNEVCNSPKKSFWRRTGSFSAITSNSRGFGQHPLKKGSRWMCSDGCNLKVWSQGLLLPTHLHNTTSFQGSSCLKASSKRLTSCWDNSLKQICPCPRNRCWRNLKCNQNWLLIWTLARFKNKRTLTLKLNSAVMLEKENKH